MDEIEGNGQKGESQTNEASPPARSSSAGAIQANQQKAVTCVGETQSSTQQPTPRGPLIKRMTGPDWVTAIATVMIFLATAAYVWYARRQWQAMSGQLTAMQGQLAQMQDQYPLLKESADAAKGAAKTAASALKDNETSFTKTLGQMKTQNALAQKQIDTAKSNAKASLDASISESKAALKASIQSLEWSQRPWVAESARIGRMFFDANGANIRFVFTLNNVGHSPAGRISIEGRLINLISSGMPSGKDYQKVCNSPANFYSGEMLFPGEPLVQTWGWTIPWKEISESKTPNILAPILYGCVEYTHGLSTKWHSTPFRYRVVQPDGHLLVQDGGFRPSTKEIPPAALRLYGAGIMGEPSPN